MRWLQDKRVVFGLVSTGVAVFAVLIFLIARNAPLSSGDIANAKLVRWDLLYKLDYEKNIVPDELKQVDGTIIKIPGFAVPLEDDMTSLSEFILVPDPQSCIHVPPPPPNQIINVTLREPMQVDQLWGPIWIAGRIEIKTTKSKYGSASFEVQNAHIQKYTGGYE